VSLDRKIDKDTWEKKLKNRLEVARDRLRYYQDLLGEYMIDREHYELEFYINEYGKLTYKRIKEK
jgi:sensor domain CHASE-containing protein